MTFCLIFNQE